MTDQILVPTADKILRPALEKIYTLRPRSFQHLNYRTGIWWHPFLGFKAQTSLMLRRLGLRVAANRLSTATKQDLLDYVASEYDAVPETDKTFAIGEMSFVRPLRVTPLVPGTEPAGDIPKGTKVTRSGNLTTQIPLKVAQYETLSDVHFDKGQLTAGPVRIRAITSGANANHPIRAGETVSHGVTVTGLFDATITVSTFSAGGGSEGAADQYVRNYAKAYAVGQYGPTEAASRYGALRATGVRNILVFDLPGTGVEQILVGDSSWASSERWASTVQQSLYDNDLVGVGCKVVVSGVQNIVVSVNATVTLRDTNYMTETTDIDNAVREAVASYLNDRSDWNIWKTDGLKAAIARSHPKVFNCPDAIMKNTADETIDEIATPDYTETQYHYFLANGAVKITYEGPT